MVAEPHNGPQWRTGTSDHIQSQRALPVSQTWEACPYTDRRFSNPLLDRFLRTSKASLLSKRPGRKRSVCPILQTVPRNSYYYRLFAAIMIPRMILLSRQSWQTFSKVSRWFANIFLNTWVFSKTIFIPAVNHPPVKRSVAPYRACHSLRFSLVSRLEAPCMKRVTQCQQGSLRRGTKTLLDWHSNLSSL
jgi:hypothetical protein